MVRPAGPPSQTLGSQKNVGIYFETQFFSKDLWCRTFQKCARINSCHPPPEKKRRVWEVLRISDIKDIKYIKISKSDIKDM